MRQLPLNTFKSNTSLLFLFNFIKHLNNPIKLFSLSLFLSFTTTTYVSNVNLKVGDNAPNFELLDQHNTLIKLADLKSKWVVLYFYPKNDTPGCTTEACSFRDNINSLISQQAFVLGVSIDTQASHQQFAKKHKLPFSLLADENGDVTKKYNALLDLVVVKFAKRHSFIIDPDGKIAKVYREVDPDKHVAEVLKDLKNLQNKASE